MALGKGCFAGHFFSRVAIAECGTRQSLCRVYFGLCRVPQTLGKVPVSRSVDTISSHHGSVPPICTDRRRCHACVGTLTGRSLASIWPFETMLTSFGYLVPAPSPCFPLASSSLFCPIAFASSRRGRCTCPESSGGRPPNPNLFPSLLRQLPGPFLVSFAAPAVYQTETARR